MPRSKSAVMEEFDDDSASDYEASLSPETSDDDFVSDEDIDPGELDDDDADLEEAVDATPDQIDLAAELDVEPQNQDDLAEIEEQIRAFDAGSSITGTTLDNLDDPSNPDEDDNLFQGNLHPPEYYRRGMMSLNEEDYKKKDYKESTLSNLKYILEQFKRYVNIEHIY